jgi:putative DNA primase/helicase
MARARTGSPLDGEGGHKVRYDIPEDILRDLGVDAVDAVDADSRSLPTPMAFPVDCMPEACRDLIRESAAAIGCPPEFIGLPMLAVLGSAIGNSRVVVLKGGWEEGAAIYAAVVAEPGEKKTPATKVAIEPAVKIQAALRDKYRQDAEEYEHEKREYAKHERELKKMGEAPPRPPDAPHMERAVVEDVTVEALATVLEGTPRGVLALRDELSGWVRSMDQYKQGGRGADRQYWLSAWSNAYTSVDRKGRAEALIIKRPFVCVYGSIQPGILEELSDGREDGLLDRFLLAYPEPVAPGWSDNEISTASREAYTALYEKMRTLHMPEDEYGDPEPTRTHFAPDAKEALKQVITDLSEERYAPGFPTRLKGPWSKLEGYFARLCLILATARAADKGVAERVEVEDVLKAAYLLDYLKSHVRRVYIGLYGYAVEDLLAADFVHFLDIHNGYFKDEPYILHKSLESEHKPSRPDELTKMLKSIANKSRAFTLRTSNFKKDGQSRRFVEISLANGVNGVNGVNRNEGGE